MSGSTSMVFTRTCDATRLLALILRNLGLKAIPINGHMSQVIVLHILYYNCNLFPCFLLPLLWEGMVGWKKEPSLSSFHYLQVCQWSILIFIVKIFWQSKRLGALNKFKSGECNILLCTDVASRGLDIPTVDMVINYDIPTNSKVRCTVYFFYTSTDMLYYN